MWDWLQSLSGGAPQFVGSLTGSAIGLIALLIGALFNAHLNRRRDDALREHDGRGLTAALYAELRGLQTSLEENARSLERDGSRDFIVPDLAQGVRIMPALLTKLPLLETDTIGKVMAAHIVLEQYIGHLTMQGGIVSNQSPNRRLVAMKSEKAANVAKINSLTAKVIGEALESLRPHLK